MRWLMLYQAYIVICISCSAYSVYWSKFAHLPVSNARRMALHDGWVMGTKGALCPECARKGE